MRTKGIFRVGILFMVMMVVAALMLMTPLIGTAEAAAPDEYNVTGRVMDAYGNSIAMATVALENGSSVQTEQDGAFSILASMGNHTLTISSSGRDTHTVEIIVGAADLDIGTVQMQTTAIDPLLWYGAIGVAIIVAVLLLIYMFLGGRKQDKELAKEAEKKDKK
jgi:flagellar basal body-associated protein FliL